MSLVAAKAAQQHARAVKGEDDAVSCGRKTVSSVSWKHRALLKDVL